ncbi:hypothetical protein tpqmel_0167 [Candidatus Gastranaerophilus sp. (ex Termes propinquus)]|nr:hypothetical protein tpqmel_0167 [Candidatus Gastranaerophilus sp. (ex Termes propinquus)]
MYKSGAHKWETQVAQINSENVFAQFNYQALYRQNPGQNLGQTAALNAASAKSDVFWPSTPLANKTKKSSILPTIAIGLAVIAANVIMKKGKPGTTKLKDIMFSAEIGGKADGIARRRNGKLFTGIIEDITRSGDKIKLLYQEGKIKASVVSNPIGSRIIGKEYGSIVENSRVVNFVNKYSLKNIPKEMGNFLENSDCIQLAETKFCKTQNGYNVCARRNSAGVAIITILKKLKDGTSEVGKFRHISSVAGNQNAWLGDATLYTVQNSKTTKVGMTSARTKLEEMLDSLRRFLKQ